jgi:hypothetical protein
MYKNIYKPVPDGPPQPLGSSNGSVRTSGGGGGGVSSEGSMAPDAPLLKGQRGSGGELPTKKKEKKKRKKQVPLVQKAKQVRVI